MAKKRRVKKNGKVHFKWVTKQGRFAYYYSTYEMMKPINIRLYFGGFFVTKNYKTEYRNVGLNLHPNTEEVCYFEIAHWIKKDLGFKDVGRIWYKRYGFTLFAGRAEIEDDKNIPDFLESPEKDYVYLC